MDLESKEERGERRIVGIFEHRLRDRCFVEMVSLNPPKIPLK